MTTTVAVVTCTIGRPQLEEAIQSVKKQTRAAKHYVFVHGEEYRQSADMVLEHHRDVIPVYLPFNNGDNGYGMAPVYALAPYVVREDVVCFLDDDNWYEPNHIETTVGLLEEHKLGWAYALRNIVDADGVFICQDNCESLGMHPNATGHYLVDNSCYVVRTDIAKAYGHAWYTPIVSDRSFQAALMHGRVECGGTGQHTVNYRLSHDGSASMPREVFIGNNTAMQHRYGDSPAWRTRQVFSY